MCSHRPLGFYETVTAAAVMTSPFQLFRRAAGPAASTSAWVTYSGLVGRTYDARLRAGLGLQTRSDGG